MSDVEKPGCASQKKWSQRRNLLELHSNIRLEYLESRIVDFARINLNLNLNDKGSSEPLSTCLPKTEVCRLLQICSEVQRLKCISAIYQVHLFLYAHREEPLTEQPFEYEEPTRALSQVVQEAKKLIVTIPKLTAAYIGIKGDILDNDLDRHRNFKVIDKLLELSDDDFLVALDSLGGPGPLEPCKSDSAAPTSCEAAGSLWDNLHEHHSNPDKKLRDAILKHTEENKKKQAHTITSKHGAPPEPVPKKPSVAKPKRLVPVAPTGDPGAVSAYGLQGYALDGSSGGGNGLYVNAYGGINPQYVSLMYSRYVQAAMQSPPLHQSPAYVKPAQPVSAASFSVVPAPVLEKAFPAFAGSPPALSFPPRNDAALAPCFDINYKASSSGSLQNHSVIPGKPVTYSVNPQAANNFVVQSFLKKESQIINSYSNSVHSNVPNIVNRQHHQFTPLVNQSNFPRPQHQMLSSFNGKESFFPHTTNLQPSTYECPHPSIIQSYSHPQNAMNDAAANTAANVANFSNSNITYLSKQNYISPMQPKTPQMPGLVYNSNFTMPMRDQNIYPPEISGFNNKICPKPCAQSGFAPVQALKCNNNPIYGTFSNAKEDSNAYIINNPQAMPFQRSTFPKSPSIFNSSQIYQYMYPYSEQPSSDNQHN